jgi:hypothetical protein
VSNLHIKRRTRQIDDARPVVLAGTGDNVIHTTVGDLALTGEQRDELSHRLRAQKRAALVSQLVSKVHAQWATFVEKCVLDVAPVNVAGAYAENGDVSPTWQHWLQRLNIRIVQDGLTMRVFFNGSEHASMTANIDPQFESDVLLMLKMEQGLGGNGTH